MEDHLKLEFLWRPQDGESTYEPSWELQMCFFKGTNQNHLLCFYTSQIISPW